MNSLRFYDEITAARNLRVPIIPAVLEDVRYPEDLQFLLQRTQSVDLTELEASRLARLDTAIIDVLERQGKTNPDRVKLRVGQVLEILGGIAALAGFVWFIMSGFTEVTGGDGFGQVGPDFQTVLIPFFVFMGGGIVGAIGAAFVLPMAQLLVWTVSTLGAAGAAARYPTFLLNTLTLAAVTAGFTVLAAIVLAYGLRLSRSPSMAFFARFASMGYALPGSVIAVGVLIPLSFVDHSLDHWLRRTLGVSSGLLLTGSMAGLVFAYVVRFLAISSQTLEAGLAKITPSMDMAARSLGTGTGGVLRRVHLPLLRGSLGCAAILVFVDVMKEMPATLLLRPFGYETLAVRIWQLTSESFWEAAALPALTIVVGGMLPVLMLVRRLQPGPSAPPR